MTKNRRFTPAAAGVFEEDDCGNAGFETNGAGGRNLEIRFVGGEEFAALSMREARSPISRGISYALEQLGKSTFRAKFSISKKDRTYAADIGFEKVREHAADFISKRLKPGNPKDGSQTPMRGHPVFTAQHATACCCRGCIFKWYGIPPDRELTAKERDFFTSLVMRWIELDLARSPEVGREEKKRRKPADPQLDFGF